MKSVTGIELVKVEEREAFIGNTLNDIKGKYGAFHIDIGSGFYIPGYITDNGYLIFFEVENDIIVAMNKYDLLSDEILKIAD